MWVVPDPARDLRAGGEGQLAQNAFDVRLRGALRDHQPSGDLAVAQPVAEQDGDLVLTLGQPAGQSKRTMPLSRAGLMYCLQKQFSTLFAPFWRRMFLALYE